MDCSSRYQPCSLSFPVDCPAIGQPRWKCPGHASQLGCQRRKVRKRAGRVQNLKAWAQASGRERTEERERFTAPRKAYRGGPSDTMEAFDEAALTLGGAAQALGAHDGRQDARLARRWRWCQVIVEKRSLGAGTSSIRQHRDPDDSLAARQGDAHDVPRAEDA